jgi:hypothetical protein
MRLHDRRYQMQRWHFNGVEDETGIGFRYWTRLYLAYAQLLSTEWSLRGVRVDGYDSAVVPTGLVGSWGPTDGFNEGWLVAPAVKDELCIGIVTWHPQKSTRCYLPGLAGSEVDNEQEFTLAATALLLISEALYRFVWPLPIVASPTLNTWWPATNTYAQIELQSHNNRKVHVPRNSSGIIDG